MNRVWRLLFDASGVASLLLFVVATAAQDLKWGIIVGPDLVAVPRGSSKIPEGIYGIIVAGVEVPFCMVALASAIVAVVWLVAFGVRELSPQRPNSIALPPR
jgi:hypothetical protein